MNEFITVLLSALGGGGIVAAILNYFSKKGDQKKDFFLVISERLDKEIIRLNKEIISLKETHQKELAAKDKKVVELEVELSAKQELIDKLKKKEMSYSALIMQLQTGAEFLPFPYWLKDNNGIMLSLNKAYEDAFLKPLGFNRADYIGFTDDKIWGSEIANNFQSNDSKAAKADDRMWVGQEGSHPLLNGWKFLKFSRYYENQLIGVGGMAIRQEEFDEFNNK